MCHACVTEAVRQSMLSRRSLFLGAAAAGTAAMAAGVMSAKPALAQAAGRLVDLTHTFDETFPTWDGQPGLSREWADKIEEVGYQLWRMTIMEHSGTHVDAPLHFSADGASVDQLPLEQLMAPLCVVDISAKAAEDPNATVDPEDIDAWLSANGEIPQGACVAMRSGWAARVGSPDYRTDAAGNFAFPGFSKAATDRLAELGVASIGVDTLSLDPGASADLPVHNSWLPGGRFGIENLAGLDQLPAKGATIFVGANKIGGGTGGLARIVALL